jgi:hypothetical protein
MKKISKQLVWDYFSIYIRLKYADEYGKLHCYTCGKEMTIDQAQAGHCLTGRRNAIIFDEEVVRPQCIRCNIFLNGNLNEFMDRLIEENGQEWWDEAKLRKYKTAKFTQEELREKYEYYKAEIDKMLLKIKVPSALPVRWQKHREVLLKKGGEV